MNDNIPERVEKIRRSDVFKRVKEIQASMVALAKSCFNEAELSDLRAVARITVEFHDYLQHGSVELAQSIRRLPYSSALSEEFREDVQNASANPFNQYDLDYLCDSILAGVDSFSNLSVSCSKLDDATNTKIEWGVISSKELFKTKFNSMFDKFVEESGFEKKCRLLLDLFRLQIIFAGLSYCR